MKIFQIFIFFNIILLSSNADSIKLVIMKASEVEKTNFKILKKEEFENKYIQKNKNNQKTKIVEVCEYDNLSLFALINEGIAKNHELSKNKKKENEYIGILLKKLKKYTFLEYELIEKELFIKGLDVALLREIKSVLKGRL